MEEKSNVTNTFSGFDKFGMTNFNLTTAQLC